MPLWAMSFNNEQQAPLKTCSYCMCLFSSLLAAVSQTETHTFKGLFFQYFPEDLVSSLTAHFQNIIMDYEMDG